MMKIDSSFEGIFHQKLCVEIVMNLYFEKTEGGQMALLDTLLSIIPCKLLDISKNDLYVIYSF